jgi:hypothetical protein
MRKNEIYFIKIKKYIIMIQRFFYILIKTYKKIELLINFFDQKIVFFISKLPIIIEDIESKSKLKNTFDLCFNYWSTLTSK